MNNLIRFILKYHFSILFFLFLLASLTLLIRFNNYQRSSFVDVTYSFKGNFSRITSNIAGYFSLKKENRILIRENNKLYNLIKESYRVADINEISLIDSQFVKQFDFITSKVINNSVNKRQNYITIDKGRKDGIEKEMAVLTINGIAGIVYDVSENFSTVLSMLNTKFTVSAKINKNEYYGPLAWPGKGEYALLGDIPHHVKLNIGDTVSTSQLTTIFPENIPIGVIHSFKKKGGNYYVIKVNLFTNFRNLKYVQVVKNRFRDEQIELENRIEND